MRIAVVFDNFGPYHVARLAAASRGCELLAVEVAGRSAEYAWMPTKESPGFRRATLLDQATSAGACSRTLRTRLNEVLSSFHPDVVAVPGWSSRAALCTLEWSVRQCIPAILMSESQSIDEVRRPIKEWIKRRCLRAFGAALVGGQSHCQYAINLGMQADRIFLGYDAVDNAYFAKGAAVARASAEKTRATLSLPEHCFLASNRFIPKKNLFFLLSAFARYRAEWTRGDHAPCHEYHCAAHEDTAPSREPSNLCGPWDLVLLGDGALRAEIEAMVARLDLKDHVHLPGFKQYCDLPAYYGLAGAFIHASTTEPWGLVVNEAMACGLPVVVSHRCGCASELVQQGSNGYLFEPSNEAALVKHLTRLSRDEQLRQAMGIASCQRVGDWGPDRFAQGLLAAAECALRVGPARQHLIDRLIAQILIAGRN